MFAGSFRDTLYSLLHASLSLSPIFWIAMVVIAAGGNALILAVR